MISDRPFGIERGRSTELWPAYGKLVALPQRPPPAGTLRIRRSVLRPASIERQTQDQTGFFDGFTPWIAHSPPDGRHAVPCRDAAVAWPMTLARKARQISSFFTKGWPIGTKAPFMPVSGLSHATGEPFPCGSSAMASAPLARRQSSGPRSADKGDAEAAFTDPVADWSSSNEPIGMEMLHAPLRRPTPITRPSRAGTSRAIRRASYDCPTIPATHQNPTPAGRIKPWKA